LVISAAQGKEKEREHVVQGKQSNKKELKWYPLNVVKK